MKRTSLTLSILLLFSGGLWAEWLFLDSLVMGPNYTDYQGRKAQGTKMKIYIENKNITKHETGIYENYLLSDYTYRRSKRNHSSISKFDLHCKESIFKVVKTTFYSELMGKGEIIEEWNDPFKGWWVFGKREGRRHGFYSHLAEEVCKLLSPIDGKIPIKKGDHNH